MKKTKIYAYLLAAVVFFLVSVLGILSAVAADEAPAEWIQSSLEKLAGESSQVLLVTNEESSGFSARLFVLEKRGNKWRNAFPPLLALIGRKGFAPPGEKKEGDVKTPSGVFALKRAFGYAVKITSRMPYRQAGDDDIWVDDASSSDYNRWVKKGETSAASFELMKLGDDRYKYGIVIEYNTDPIIRGAGSAIFIHVRRGENIPTMGCVALSECDLVKILGRLVPAEKPLVVMGTRHTLVQLSQGVRESSVALAGNQGR